MGRGFRKNQEYRHGEEGEKKLTRRQPLHSIQSPEEVGNGIDSSSILCRCDFLWDREVGTRKLAGWKDPRSVVVREQSACGLGWRGLCSPVGLVSTELGGKQWRF